VGWNRTTLIIIMAQPINALDRPRVAQLMQGLLGAALPQFGLGLMKK